MKKSEAKWQTIWNQYLREQKIPGFFELKYTTKNSFPFSKLEIHQYDGLQATQKNGLVWKFSDEDSRKKPCDCVSIPPLPSYLVIRFTDAYYMMDISDVVSLRESGRISITREEADSIAKRIVLLGRLTPTPTPDSIKSN